MPKGFMRLIQQPNTDPQKNGFRFSSFLSLQYRQVFIQ